MVSAPLSQHRSHGDLVFTSGQLGFEPDGTVSPDFGRQTELAMESLKSRLESAGSSLECVLKATVFITRRGDFAAMNEIYGRFFAEPWPARSTIVTELVLPELLFEIEVVAHRADA